MSKTIKEREALKRKIKIHERFRTVRKRLFFVFWAVLLVSFFTAISLQYSRYQKLLADEASLLNRIKEEEDKNVELQQKMDYYYSDAFIEEVAREQLGLVRDNEYLFCNEANN